MPDILCDFPVNAPIERVFAAISTPEGLDAWWTLRSAGEPRPGATYQFYFGEPYDWRGVVSRLEPGRLIEWHFTRSDADWKGTRVGAELTQTKGGTQVQFWHRGGPDTNAHYRTSSFCWAMYLRLLKRWAEAGEVVPYERRLDA